MWSTGSANGRQEKSVDFAPGKVIFPSNGAIEKIKSLDFLKPRVLEVGLQHFERTDIGKVPERRRISDRP
jgi:hypothetical protein